MGAHDRIFVFCPMFAGFLIWGTFSYEKMGM
jgi:hypothetical protein